MYLKRIELTGFKSFAHKTALPFTAPITAIVGPNGSGKSNVAEAFRWVLGEQALSTLRGKRGEDFIFNGSHESARLNRASVVITFDNRPGTLSVGTEATSEDGRPFPFTFDEVVLARHVYRDGTNDYYLNQSKVRLKDVLELMSSVGLGVSSHFIISQGEADRMLAVNANERLKLVEDALGLAVFEYKRKEARKKLEKTEETLRQVDSLRREIAPHLKYLKKQVSELERAEAMRADLCEQYRQYFFSEERYLARARGEHEHERKLKGEELQVAEKEQSELSEMAAPGNASRKQLLAQRAEAESTLAHVRDTKDEVARTLGRLEGMAQASRAALAQTDTLPQAGHRCPTCGQEVLPQNSTAHLDEIRSQKERRLHELEGQERNASRLLHEAIDQERALVARVEEARTSLDSYAETVREADRRLFAAGSHIQELKSALSLLRLREEKLAIEEADFKRECGEAAALLGREALRYREGRTEVEPEADRAAQEKARRDIERLKIRIEEVGGGGSDVLKEYEELTARDQFLTKEVEDLTASARSLEKLMDDLGAQLKTRFHEGVEAINRHFREYFALLFGGGTASLEVVRAPVRRRGVVETDSGDEEDAKTEEGIEINIALPRKKLRGLQMLSGGERTLASLALLFAVSQVNPPPFLVLDETDAALDEANSKKYGEMLKKLSERSQLIIITHNRETMSHAGVLYGITLGKEATSRVLSIKFEEAEAIAAR
ncbi:MAG: hypothetical protein COV10_00185 [Candidatus Vogelbacteria bacterium CG10_big_fil_rev_8_21_14_0_10_51_16]|uniref:RecF/RecN/SMC N-terminal domain-containing protein n=1 Tax=Candidatus Vogelbacteria bacterium CG10_big_fil_rev_8_21_14_0_10_51_16 TaxID=1975045 RepID=A0A2H0RFF0_9BACT|nr:MAG: hypothetical protein COV10_00185 [Candidatus Vogelbacteria bacterium CG10_big_fil_rev_8_21_14_0_10_51_16]